MTKQELLTTIEALPLESKKGLLTHFRINKQGDLQTVDLAKQIAAKIGILECMDIMKRIESQINAST